MTSERETKSEREEKDVALTENKENVMSAQINHLCRQYCGVRGGSENMALITSQKFIS